MRILVAEDSADNRDLLTSVLQNRGHSVTGVCNGREALAALEHANFELIFMDEEMPGMGGIEATRAIRAIGENPTSIGNRPIIVGVSGNNTEADEKRCLDAGMDAFLAKPVGIRDVFRLIDLLARQPQLPVAPQTDSPSPDSPFETLAAHLHCATGGDANILRSLVKTFLADAPETLSVLRRAIAQKDAEALAVTAHSFKGSLGIVGAQKAAALAANLQAMGRSGDLAGAAAEFRTLEDEFNSVRGELLTLQAATPPKAKPARKFAAKSRLKR